MRRVRNITWGGWYWPAGLSIASLLFVPAEIFALLTNSANTLSDYCWAELHVNPHLTVHTSAWWASIVAWVLFVAVITGHIWFRAPG